MRHVSKWYLLLSWGVYILHLPKLCISKLRRVRCIFDVEFAFENFPKVLSSSQTFCHNESMPSSSGAGGVFAVLGTTHTFRAAGPFQKFLFQKFLSEFAKRVDVWISILTTTTITTTTKN